MTSHGLSYLPILFARIEWASLQFDDIIRQCSPNLGKVLGNVRRTRHKVSTCSLFIYAALLILGLVSELMR